ncbi:MAG TPA: DUF1232 domain-containing protein [Bacteroidales bacterium]|nr:DUF1232 domain-containing protein [Bacteroidales bacterium]
MPDPNQDFYQRLRGNISEWLQAHGGHTYGEILMLAPDLFHLLCKLSLDSRIPAKSKAELAGAIAYFVSPVDLIPEAVVGAPGYIDDIVVSALVLKQVINNSDPEIVHEHWAGDGDILEVVQHILDVADEMVGSGLWQKIKRRFGGAQTS